MGEPVATDTIVPDFALRGLTWSLPDAIAAGIEPGRVMKVCVVLRFTSAREFKDGRRRWETELLEVCGTHD